MRSVRQNRVRVSWIAGLAIALAVSLQARGAFAQGAGAAGPAAPAPATTTPASPPPTPSSVAAPVSPPTPDHAPTPSTVAAPASPPPASDRTSTPSSAPAADSGLSLASLGRAFELMPPSAFPSPPAPRVRGLYGGSLWLEPDFQGLQWPYYPKTGVGFSGSGWIDTGLRDFHAGEPFSGSAGLGSQEQRGKQFVQQSRIVLRTTPTWSDRNQAFFVQLQVELVGAKIDPSQSAGFVWGADDAWIRFGKWKLFDILIGRFQAWEVYHYGMGLDLYTLERSGANDGSNGTPPPIYGLTYMYSRQDLAGQGAVHLYPSDWLRFEVGFQYGPTVTGDNATGVRPVGIAEFGPLRVKAGMEFLDSQGQAQGAKQETRQQGGALAAQVVLPPHVEFGVNGAWAQNDARDSQGRITAADRFQTFSVGGFANARIIEDLLVGVGLNYTRKVDVFYDTTVHRDDNYDQLQPYGAVQYLLLKQLFLKAVFAYARADMNPVPSAASNIPFRNEMFSGRLRVLYLF